jgi:hypothetical protein
MIIVSTRIGTGPPEDWHIGDRRLERRAFDDFYVLSRLGGWKNLSSRWIRE